MSVVLYHNLRRSLFHAVKFPFLLRRGQKNKMCRKEYYQGAMSDLEFHKFQGAGNDFIVIDNRRNKYVTSDFHRRQMCDRHFGIGADGILEIRTSELADFRVSYYNSDGKEGSLCGNGCRCAIAFAWGNGIRCSMAETDKQTGKGSETGPGRRGDSFTAEGTVEMDRVGKAFPVYQFEAADGVHCGGVQHVSGAGHVTYFLRFRDVTSEAVTVYGRDEMFLDTGSPHHVTFLASGLDELDVFNAGRQLRYERYGQKGSNINFVTELTSEGHDAQLTEAREKIVEPARLRVRTYERGVEGETLACGTGAVAVAIAHYLKNCRGGHLTNQTSVVIGHTKSTKSNYDVTAKTDDVIHNLANGNVVGRGKPISDAIKRDQFASDQSEIVNEITRDRIIRSSFVERIIVMKGGDLKISFKVMKDISSSDQDGPLAFTNIEQSGPAELVFRGVYSLKDQIT